MIRSLWNKLFKSKSREEVRQELRQTYPDTLTNPSLISIHSDVHNIGRSVDTNYTNSILGYSGPLLYGITTPQPMQMRSLQEILVDFTEELYQSGVVLDTLALRDSSYQYLVNTVGGPYSRIRRNPDYDQVVLRTSYGDVKITPEVKHTIKKYSIGYEDVPN